MKATIKKITWENVTVASLKLKTESKLRYKAGQGIYVKLNGERKEFTLSSSPAEENLQITKSLSGSEFKKTLMNLKGGQKIEISRPAGRFCLEEKAGNYLFIAGGIGITTFRSI